MTRIAERFAQLKKDGSKGFIPFVTAGDPNLELSLEIVIELARLGASVIEIGVPFSDPMADGPTIQRSSQRALQNGTNLTDILEMVRQGRKTTDVPVVLFSYFNPLLQFGLDKLADGAADVGIDAILITDAIDEEARSVAGLLNAKNIDLISLIAPTTTDKRLERISQVSSGFLYAVSRAGVTGVQSETSSAAEELVSRARKFTDLPIAVGFGISTRDQVIDVWRYADAAVVGSAIVAEVERSNERESILPNVVARVLALLPRVANTSTDT